MARLVLLSVLSFSSLVFAQQGAAPKPEPLPELRPPLGSLGEVMDPVERGGVPAGELAVTARFDGCPEAHTFYLSRALLRGAVGAGEKLAQWLDGQPALVKKLYGKKGNLLGEAVKKARTGTFAEGRACRPSNGTFPDVALATGARITARTAPPALCKLERGSPDKGGTWLFTRNEEGKVSKRGFTGAVLFLPPEEGAKKPCLPRLSVALFDEAGTTRLRYHADYNGAVDVELPGDRCTRVHFTFDAHRQVFVPKVDRDPACAKAKPAPKP